MFSSMSRLKKIALSLGIIFAALQLYRTPRNVALSGPNDLIAQYAPPPGIKHLLEVSCYDCHSNQTRYPWYAEIQPAAWWLSRHIEEGKRELNFSEFAAYSPHRQAQKLLAISDEIQGHTMPLRSYTWIHRDARLSEAEVKALVEWSEGLAEQIDSGP
jgi:hypothetical protein